MFKLCTEYPEDGDILQRAYSNSDRSYSLVAPNIAVPESFNDDVNICKLITEYFFLQVGLCEVVSSLKCGLRRTSVYVYFALDKEDYSQQVLSDLTSLLLKLFDRMTVLEEDETIIGFYCKMPNVESCIDIFDSLCEENRLDKTIADSYRLLNYNFLFDEKNLIRSYNYIPDAIFETKCNHALADYYMKICKKFRQPFDLYIIGWEEKELSEQDWFKEFAAEFKTVVVEFKYWHGKWISIGITVAL